MAKPLTPVDARVLVEKAACAVAKYADPYRRVGAVGRSS